MTDKSVERLKEIRRQISVLPKSNSSSSAIDDEFDRLEREEEEILERIKEK